MKALFSAMVVWVMLLSPTAWGDEVSVKRALTEENIPIEGERCVVDMRLSKDGQVELNWTGSNKRPPISPPGFIISGQQVPEAEALLKKSLEWLRIARDKNVLPFDKTIGQFGNEPVVFSYNDKKAAYLWTFNIDVDAAPAILKMLQQYPDAKKELDEKLARSAKESELFK